MQCHPTASVALVTRNRHLDAGHLAKFDKRCKVCAGPVFPESLVRGADASLKGASDLAQSRGVHREVPSTHSAGHTHNRTGRALEQDHVAGEYGVVRCPAVDTEPGLNRFLPLQHEGEIRLNQDSDV